MMEAVEGQESTPIETSKAAVSYVRNTSTPARRGRSRAGGRCWRAPPRRRAQPALGTPRLTSPRIVILLTFRK